MRCHLKLFLVPKLLCFLTGSGSLLISSDTLSFSQGFTCSSCMTNCLSNGVQLFRYISKLQEVAVNVRAIFLLSVLGQVSYRPSILLFGFALSEAFIPTTDSKILGEVLELIQQSSKQWDQKPLPVD